MYTIIFLNNKMCVSSFLICILDIFLMLCWLGHLVLMLNRNGDSSLCFHICAHKEKIFCILLYVFLF